MDPLGKFTVPQVKNVPSKDTVWKAWPDDVLTCVGLVINTSSLLAPETSKLLKESMLWDFTE